MQNRIDDMERSNAAKFDQILALLAPQKPDSPVPAAPWAEVARKTAKRPEVPQVVIVNKKANLQKPERAADSQVKPPTATPAHRGKRLIVQTTREFMEGFDSMTTRDQINRVFREKGQSQPVIALITKSESNQSLIITTMPTFSAEYLMEKEGDWALCCALKSRGMFIEARLWSMESQSDLSTWTTECSSSGRR
jgi:hypothetical protein